MRIHDLKWPGFTPREVATLGVGIPKPHRDHRKDVALVPIAWSKNLDTSHHGEMFVSWLSADLRCFCQRSFLRTLKADPESHSILPQLRVKTRMEPNQCWKHWIDNDRHTQGNRRPKIRRSEDTCSIYRLKFHLDMDVRWELSGTLHLS